MRKMKGPSLRLASFPSPESLEDASFRIRQIAGNRWKARKRLLAAFDPVLAPPVQFLSTNPPRM